MNTRIFDNSLCMSFCRRSWLKAAWGALGFASTACRAEALETGHSPRNNPIA
jgi:hypothetical protein